MIYVLGGEVDLVTVDGDTLVLPTGYGLCFDPSGREIDRCSLFIGPIVVTNERVDKLPKWAVEWFGPDYEAKKARVDIPSRGWESHGQVKEIFYYRPGEHEADWHHEFSKPVVLSKRSRWYRMKLPSDCRITWRGIEKP